MKLNLLLVNVNLSYISYQQKDTFERKTAAVNRRLKTPAFLCQPGREPRSRSIYDIIASRSHNSIRAYTSYTVSLRAKMINKLT